MGRFWLAVGLTLLGLMASGCSSYYVDAANYRQQRVVASDNPPPRARVAGRTSRAVAATADDEVVTTGSSFGNLKPWPKQGTPDWDRMQAHNDEIDRRARAATNSICRGC